MSSIEWNQTGRKYFELGLDKGVIYPFDLPGIPWNGIISVDIAKPNSDTRSLYQEGVKYHEEYSLGDTEALVTAYTYPELVSQYEGYANINGLKFASQDRSRFGLSYRTKIGNDVMGIDYGYQIHLLYNCMLSPSENTYESINGDPEAIEFSWNITTIPEFVDGYHPVAHIIIDSRNMSVENMRAIENILYGTDISDPRMPTPAELISLTTDNEPSKEQVLYGYGIGPYGLVPYGL